MTTPAETHEHQFRHGTTERMVGRCIPCGLDALVYIADLERKLADAEAAVASYEDGITWQTTCHNCASLLDRCYAETVRAEKAEAELARRDAVVEAVRMFVKDNAALCVCHGDEMGYVDKVCNKHKLERAVTALDAREEA